MATNQKAAAPQKGGGQYNKVTGGGGAQNQWFGGDEAVAQILDSTDAGGMRGAGLIAFMIAQIVLKNKVVDLAEDYYETNEKDYKFFLNNHQPAIAATAREAFNPALNPTYGIDYYASTAAGMAISSDMDRKWFEARRRTGRYNTGVQDRLDYDFAIQRTAMLLSGWNMGRRYEMNWTDAHNERAFNRKVAVANIGIDVGNISAQGLATAVSGVTNAYDNIGDTVASIGNGLSARAGYNAGRQGTRKAYEKENS